MCQFLIFLIMILVPFRLAAYEISTCGSQLRESFPYRYYNDNPYRSSVPIIQDSACMIAKVVELPGEGTLVPLCTGGSYIFSPMNFRDSYYMAHKINKNSMGTVGYYVLGLPFFLGGWIFWDGPKAVLNCMNHENKSPDR